MDYSLYLTDEQATLEFASRLASATIDQTPMIQNQAQSAEKVALEAKRLGGATTFYLYGTLGAGKTCLARGFVRSCGYVGKVKSPTYTLVEPYEFESFNLYHFDLYRLADADEIDYLGVDDYFTAPNIVLIEWPQRGGRAIPPADIALELVPSKTGRLLTCQGKTEKGQAIIQRLSL